MLKKQRRVLKIISGILIVLIFFNLNSMNGRSLESVNSAEISSDNIALNKTASASSTQDSSHDPAMGLDNDDSTMWIAANGEANNWWEVDLGTNYDLTGSEIEFENSINIWTFKIQVSSNNANWTTVADESNNTDSSQTQSQSFTASARYIRVLFGHAPSSCWTAFREFQVFGSQQSEATNLALNKTTSANSTQDVYHESDMGVDNNEGTMWIAADGEANNWWEVDLGINCNLTGSKIEFETGDVLWTYQIQVSNDNNNWTTVADKSSNTDSSQIQTQSFSASARYIRVLFGHAPSSCWTAFREFQAFGTSDGAPETPTDLTAAAVGQSKINITWSPSDNATSYDLYVDGTVVSNATSPYQVTGLAADSMHIFKIFAKNSVGSSEYSLPVTTTTQIADSTQGKRIMILVAHEDDEAIIASGVIEDALSKGYPVKLVLATNGDYQATDESKGQMRLNESINAMQVLGLTRDNIIALGYGDTGGEPNWSAQSDSFLYKLYHAESGTQIIPSSVGNTTYGIPGTLDDYHYLRTGTHGPYNRDTFLSDLSTAIDEFKPTDIYTTSIYDIHADHEYINLFARDVINSIKQQDNSFAPILHEAIIHGAVSDQGWPVIITDPTPIQPVTRPGVLDNTTLDWNSREIIPVPADMLVTPRTLNRKFMALEQYYSQFSDCLGAYAESDEVFWTTDFSGI